MAIPTSHACSAHAGRGACRARATGAERARGGGMSAHAHGHSHGLVDRRSSARGPGCARSALASRVLAAPPRSSRRSFVATGSVALLADLIHNFGDAATAIPLGIAFLLRSRARSAAPGSPSSPRSSSAPASPASRRSPAHRPAAVDHLGALAAAGAVGFAGNWVAASVRTRAGRRLDSPALVADGDHARADAYVSLAVIASAAVVALGVRVADPLIGLGDHARDPADHLAVVADGARPRAPARLGPRHARPRHRGVVSEVTRPEDTLEDEEGPRVDRERSRSRRRSTRSRSARPRTAPSPRRRRAARRACARLRFCRRGGPCAARDSATRSAAPATAAIAVPSAPYSGISTMLRPTFGTSATSAGTV